MNPTPESCLHLTVEIVPEFHAEVIARMGGGHERDRPRRGDCTVAAPVAEAAVSRRPLGMVGRGIFYYRGQPGVSLHGDGHDAHGGIGHRRLQVDRLRPSLGPGIGPGHQI